MKPKQPEIQSRKINIPMCTLWVAATAQIDAAALGKVSRNLASQQPCRKGCIAAESWLAGLPEVGALTLLGKSPGESRQVGVKSRQKVQGALFLFLDSVSRLERFCDHGEEERVRTARLGWEKDEQGTMQSQHGIIGGREW